ncbi:MAG: heme-binding protein [Candidatus Sericytochromatia bacterium]|nr:heme-binding protein [Candidatus Sericytochromatia bacterium]
MGRKWWWVAGGVVAAVLVVGGQTVSARTEEPAYELLRRIGEVEIRRYAPQIRATTVVDGPLAEATNEGFRRLAGYIFGNNTRQAKIAMTTPVATGPTESAPAKASEKIAMTTPVGAVTVDGRSTITFVMPAGYTMATLPIPGDSRVVLEEVGMRTVAVLRFSWTAGEREFAQRRQEVLDILAAAGVKPTGEATLARYDPPWTLPFLRRNEVLVPVADEGR